MSGCRGHFSAMSERVISRGTVAATAALVFCVASVLAFRWSARELWSGSLNAEVDPSPSFGLALVALVCAVVAIADGRPRWLVWSVFPLTLFVMAWALLLCFA